MREYEDVGSHEKKEWKGNKGKDRNIYVGVVEAEVSGISHFIKDLIILE